MNLKKYKHLIQVILEVKIILRKIVLFLKMIVNYLVFQQMHRYFKKIGNTDNISDWKSKGVSDEVIKPHDNTLPQN